MTGKARAGAGREAALAALAAAVLFGVTAPLCGVYLDDYSFFSALSSPSARELWGEFVRYVPGRNLHIPFFWLFLKLTGGSVPALHLVTVAFDAANAALLLLIVRRLTGLRSVAWAAAAAFVVAPNHGETHFWITLIPQCQIPVFLALSALSLALTPGRLAACAAVYAVALFTYDQVFFLWPLLLAAAWRADRSPRPRRYAAAAAGLACLNVLHTSVRYLSPWASGGRPLVRLADVLQRSRDAVVALGKGVIPWPTSPHAAWPWEAAAIAAAALAAAWLVGAVRRAAAAEAGALEDFTESHAWLGAAAAGLAWAALAYLPNLFWYISPRHNLLPSVGWSLSVAAVGAAAARSRALRPVLLAAGWLFLGAAAVSDVNEGTQWIDAARLHDALDAELKRGPRTMDAVFLLGAPRYLRRAPAFNLPHDVALAAGRALGRRAELVGDYHASPTRRGLIFDNDLTIAPPDVFRWIASPRAIAVGYDPRTRAFKCAASLKVTRPDGAADALPLMAGEGCAPAYALDADAALASSRALPRRTPGPAPKASLAVEAASLSAAGGATRLDVSWRALEDLDGPVAFLPRVLGPDGSVLLDSVFPSPGGKPYPVIWPLVDDLSAPAKAGAGARASFLLRRAPPRLPAGARLELAAYAMLSDGTPKPCGSAVFPLPPAASDAK